MNQQHTAGLNRQDLRTWSRIKVKVVKPDKDLRRGPSCHNTNILQGCPSKKSLRGGYAPSRMRPKTKRWRKVPCLRSQRNGVSHLVRNPLFWCGKPARPAPKHTSNWEDFLQTLEWSTYSFNARTGQSMWSFSSSLEAKGGGWKVWSVTTWEWIDRVNLGNVTRPRPQSHFD